MLSYLDASAAIKLVFLEPGTDALRRSLNGRDTLMSSEILDVEVRCAARRRRGSAPLDRAEAALRRIELLALSEPIRRRAGEPFDPPQRALDAVHLATALALAPIEVEFVSYDAQQLAAARNAGLTTVSP